MIGIGMKLSGRVGMKLSIINKVVIIVIWIRFFV